MKQAYFKNNFLTIYKDTENQYRVWLTGTAICFVYDKAQVKELLK